MRARLAFQLALVAAVAMLTIGAFTGVTAPSCHPLPMPTLLAFELARSAGDLQRIFAAAGDACRAPLAAQLNHVNLLDSLGYIPAYTAFYALVLFGLGRRDLMIGWIGVGVVLVCAIADETENVAMFQLSAAPDTPSVWLTALIIATNVKWIGLGVATTLGGVMLLRRGWFGWLGFLACIVPLGISFWALVAPDAAGAYLIVGMTVASVVLLAVALWGSFANEAKSGA